jgi:mersacidin/lichenicidin family type 2 lantibiotic
MYMKFDIVRAGKDDSYRQSLGTEQLNTFSTNPVGELSDIDLESIYGGQGAVGFGASSDFAASQRVHSFAVFCDRNTFSINARKTSTGEIEGDIDLLAINAIEIGNCVTQVCTNND